MAVDSGAEVEEAAIVGKPSKIELETVDELTCAVKFVPMADGEISPLELVFINERVVDVELDVLILRLGKEMLLDILEETRLDVVTRLEADFGVDVVVALELVEVVLLMFDEAFKLVEGF